MGGIEINDEDLRGLVNDGDLNDDGKVNLIIPIIKSSF